MRKSINKTTVIIVLAIFLSLSVGYALFSDTITIEGTATAQGNFNVDATCVTNLDDELKSASTNPEEVLRIAESGYNNESCVVNNDSVTYSVGLEYPGAKKLFAIKFTNVGTITAKFPLEFIEENHVGKVKITRYNSKTNDVINIIENSNDFYWGSYLAFHKAGNLFVSLDDEGIDEFISLDEEYILLRNGNGIYLIFLAEWPEEGYSEENVYYKANITIEFPFEQYNG